MLILPQSAEMERGFKWWIAELLYKELPVFSDVMLKLETF